MLTIETAVALMNQYEEQATRNDLKGADGERLKFKIVPTTEDKRVKARFNVVLVEMVQKNNLLSGLPFWIDRDTPLYLDPSSETYHSM